MTESWTAMSISANEFIQENNDAGSDSESNSDDGRDNHYRPISAEDYNDEEVDESADYRHDYSAVESNGAARAFENPNSFHLGFPNGHMEEEERGISSLDLSGSDDVDVDDDDDREEERVVSSDSEAISRAFREDERRRNAPLTPENATRIRDAMRGVSFGGIPPDWAHSVPEDRWIDQLRRLRTQTSSAQH